MAMQRPPSEPIAYYIPAVPFDETTQVLYQNSYIPGPNHTPNAAPVAFSYFVNPILGSVFPERNEPMLPQNGRVGISGNQLPPTMVNHPVMHGGGRHIDMADKESILDESPDPFLCPRYDAVFTIPFDYESHMWSQCEVNKRFEGRRKEVAFDRAVGKKPIGRNIEKTVEKKQCAFERAVRKKPIIRNIKKVVEKKLIGFERAARKEAPK